MAATGKQQREGLVSESSLDEFKGSNHKQDNNADAVTAVGSLGFGPCQPRWLQIFAKPIYFMIILNIYCFVEGTIASGKDSVI